MAYNDFKGSKYLETKELSRVEVAKLIRADLKEAVSKGILPKGFRASVRNAKGGRSLYISIEAWPHNVTNPAYSLHATILPHTQTELPRLSRAVNIAIRRIEAIGEAYNFDNSEPETDYFNCRFYLSVGVSSDLELAHRKQLIESVRYAELLADLRVQVGMPPPGAPTKYTQREREEQAAAQCAAQCDGARTYREESHEVREFLRRADASPEERTKIEEAERIAALHGEIAALRAENARLKSEARETDPDFERKGLIAQADAAHATFPQYAKHWDAWQVGTVTHDVTTKAGLAFKAGDRVLVEPVDRRSGLSDFRTAYSFRNECDTSIPGQWLRLDAPRLSLVKP